MQEIIEKYLDRLNKQYPKYSDYTAHCSGLFTELLNCDYNDFPSANKSMRYVKSILEELITYTFINVGVKNYLKMIMEFFDLPEVKDFFSSAKIDTNELYKIIECVKSRIIYWQGFENSPPEKHLKHILKPLINTKLK